MDLTCSKGDSIVLLNNTSQTFEGEVKSINKELGRLLLTNIVQQPGHKVIEGYRHFDRNEIVDIKIKKQEKSAENLISCNGETDRLEGDGNQFSVSKEIENRNSRCKEMEKLQSEYKYIKDFGRDFHSAISSLKECKIVGLYVKDASKGRFERLLVMAFSTFSDIFIFDLQNLGDDALEKGLRDVLESLNIVKVVHDCRLLSDCLKHMHLVTLENVRDVEAEDIMVIHQERKMIRQHSRSLDYLIKMYLNVDVANYNIPFETWGERPLPLKLLKLLVSYVSYLIPLQEAIEKKFLQRLINASNIYKDYLRDFDIFNLVHSDSKNTLRNELIELVRRQSSPRCDTYKVAKV